MWRFVILFLLSTATTSPIGESDDTKASNEIVKSTTEPWSYKTIIKEYCLAYSSIEAYNNITLAEKKDESCASNAVREAEKELASANPNSTSADRFIAMCRKSTEIANCYGALSSTLDVCQRPDTRGLFKKVLEVYLNFICFQDGARYLSFTADGGAECVQSKLSGIEDCVEETFSKYLPLKIPADKTAPRTAEETEAECRDVFALKTCVLSQLKSCEKATTANLAEELGDQLIKVTPCEKFYSKEVKSTETPTVT